MRWFRHVQRKDAGYVGRRILRIKPPSRRGMPRRRCGKGGHADEWCGKKKQR